MPTTPGSDFGPYRIVEPLGRGGMAWVYKAYEPALDRYIALKVLQPESPSPTFGERFRREAKVIARLEHRHIIPIHAFGIDEDVPWMAMRLVQGGTLSTLLGSGAVERRRAVAILRECAEALDHAHRQGVLHRDVKPQNILLDQDGHVYLADFGIAKLVEDSVALTRTGVVAGTPHYMSPEQARAENVDHRADIYALGVIAYELFAGRVPFTADSSIAVLLKHVSAPVPVPSPSEVPPRLCVPVLKALAKNPDDRWPTATAFVKALEAALAEPETGDVPTVEIDLASETPTTELPAAALAGIAAPPDPAAPEPPAALATPTPIVRPEPAPSEPAASHAEPGSPKTAPAAEPTATGAAVTAPTRPRPSVPIALIVAAAAIAIGITLLLYLVVWRPTPAIPAPEVAVLPSASPGAPAALPTAPPTAVSETASPAKVAPSPGAHPARATLLPAATPAPLPTSASTRLPAPAVAPAPSLRTNALDGLDYVRIPPGTFQMGCVPGDSCDLDEQPRHPVTLGRELWMGRTEVTVGAYTRFTSGTRRSMPLAPAWNADWRDESHPMVNVTWEDARAFCEWSGGRLPTEAEWEYAARGGREGAIYPWGNTISHEQANFEGVQGSDQWANTSPVGSFAANGFGLHDMAGNVWEWMADWYGETYYSGAPSTDPKGPPSGKSRVVRGGSWLTNARTLRASARPWLGPSDRYGALGFRCVRDAAP
jgi:formylglycine-generating enzyme required for sulfatase activity/serine/threonine protein kinase